MGLNDYTVVIWSHFGAVAASIGKGLLVIRSPVFKRFYCCNLVAFWAVAASIGKGFLVIRSHIFKRLYCNHLVAFLGSGYLPAVKAF